MFNNFQFGTNELIWLLLLFVNYFVILISYRMWGKVGLFIFVPISVILANIQVLKMMTLFGVNTTMGNIAYGGVFLVSDILSENYGKKMAQHIISIGFYTLISFVVIMNVVLLITPAPNDIAQPHLEIIFKAMPRIIIASLSAFVAEVAMLLLTGVTLSGKLVRFVPLCSKTRVPLQPFDIIP